MRYRTMTQNRAIANARQMRGESIADLNVRPRSQAQMISDEDYALIRRLADEARMAAYQAEIAANQSNVKR